MFWNSAGQLALLQLLTAVPEVAGAISPAELEEKFDLAYHLKHGFQSAFQTFGLKNSRYERLIEFVGMLFWLLVPLGFAAMPLYFLWAY